MNTPNAMAASAQVGMDDAEAPEALELAWLS